MTITYVKVLQYQEKDMSYDILETVHERLYGNTWHKLILTHSLWKMITEDKKCRGSSWDKIKEITGETYIWVTDKYLTLLEIKGACREN